MNPMGIIDHNSFDFDEWSALARADSEAFERRREECIAAFLEAAPEHRRQRLRGLQFQIDMERLRAGTPLGAAVRLNSMMWSSVAELQYSLESLVDGSATTEAPRREATLLRFPQRS